MNKFWTVLSHTYISKLRTKSFILTTLISALLLVGLTNIQQIIGWFADGEPEKVAVLDDTGELYEPLAAQIQQTSEDIELIDFEQGEDAAKQEVQNENMTGYLLLSMNHAGVPEATYKAEKISGQSVTNELKQALQQVKVTIATQQLGLGSEEIAAIFQPVTFEEVALDQGAKSEKELNQARALVYALVILIFFSVIFYGSMIMTEIATEKSSRVMEILISSVSPVKQMFGKIFGVALLSLTHIAVLLVVGYFSLKMSFDKTTEGASDFFTIPSIDAVPVATIVYAAVFFILGYLLYSTMLAMLGSLVSRVEDSQQMMMPVTFLSLAGFYIALFGLGVPESTFITVTSFIPFFSPMIMFLRVGLLTVPFWQVALSIAILIVTIMFFVMIGARVYRGGVLMYGKTSWKSMKEALTLSKAEK